ncbi:MAG TPA: hypothetical protein VK063_04125 [Beutenbergiaceae bacterium]|nr:hypothetical protein [Beutenbergiaceae bacterium]
MTSIDDAAAGPRPSDRVQDPPGAQPAPREVPALRLSGAELAVLLALRDTRAADISRQGLGISIEPGSDGRNSLADRGLWQVRHGIELPAAQAIAVGDTLTAAMCWLRIGTPDAAAATIVIGPEHTLLLAALGDGAQEIATLRVDADIAGVTAGICDHLTSMMETDAQVHVHVVGLPATGTPSERVIPATDHRSGDDDAAPALAARLREAISEAIGR